MIHQNHRHLICLILESVRQWIQLQLSLLPVPVLLKMTLTRKSRRKWQCRFSIRFANLAMLNTYWNRKDKAFSSCRYQNYWPQAIPVRMIQVKMQWHSIIWRFHIIWWMKARVALAARVQDASPKIMDFCKRCQPKYSPYPYALKDELKDSQWTHAFKICNKDVFIQGIAVVSLFINVEQYIFWGEHDTYNECYVGVT